MNNRGGSQSKDGYDSRSAPLTETTGQDEKDRWSGVRFRTSAVPMNSAIVCNLSMVQPLDLTALAASYGSPITLCYFAPFNGPIS